ncbi:hypothetical protein [Homoserinibacter sp. GY 40078]|uniref:hypothetical protein n=1 Tax=Homoserinibacter sp. GY 40078 TaxID=2603275 RepID=UPI0011C7F587|nr:hypothetical protein [Homoserinibacter sp. GY 40078]TXK17408.1 hypothetical protein FVQ89_11275 [Homoserinibacter sp. GY 40078]
MGRKVERVRPFSRVLPALIRWHRAALRYDLAPLGVRVEDFTSERCSWNEFWDYVSEILREPSSHLFSALAGDKYVPHPAERAAWAVFEQDINTRQKRGAIRIRIPRPWAGKSPNYGQSSATEVTPDRLARRAKLAAMF